MENMKIIAIALIMCLVYIVVINYISEMDLSLGIEYTDGGFQRIDSGMVNIGVGDSVSYQIKRPRWYGTIYEDQNNAKLYLFEIIPLPMKNYVYVHFVYLIILTSFLYFKLRKTKINKVDYGYERGWEDEYLD